MEELKELDICFGKILKLPEVLQDPQVRHRGLIAEYVPPASFGEHTEELLKKMGYREGEIEGLKKEGVI